MLLNKASVCSTTCRVPAVPRNRAAIRPPAPLSHLLGSSKHGRCLIARFKDENNAQANTTLVPVVFELSKHCAFGHAFALVGDAPQLGQWDVSKALKLEWSEGDVWRGTAQLPLDAPVSFKYVQVSSSGRLVAWGQDIGGGDNLSVVISASDEVMSGLQLALDPADAADASHSPHLVVRLDASAILPESAARFKEAQAHRAEAAAAAADAEDIHHTGFHSDLNTTTAPAAAADSAPEGQEAAAATLSPRDQEAVSAGVEAVELGPAEADAVMAADDDFELEQQPPSPTPQEGPPAAAAADSVGQLMPEQHQDQDSSDSSSDTSAATAAEHDEEPQAAAAVVPQVVEAEPGTSSESVGEQQGLAAQAAAPTAVPSGDAPGDKEAEKEPAEDSNSPTDPLQAAAAALGVGAPEGSGVTPGVAAGGLAAGFEDEGSVGAAVQGGLMEAGDDETAAGSPLPFEAHSPSSDSFLSDPPAGPDSPADSSIHSHSINLEEEEEEEEQIPTPPPAAAAGPEAAHRDAAHLTTTSQVGTDASRHAATAAAAPAAAAAAAAAAPHSSDVHELLAPAGAAEATATPQEGEPAVAAAEELNINSSSGACRPAPPHSKLVTASGPSVSTFDPSAPLQDPSKAITEVDSSSRGLQPVDSYEDKAFRALATAAAAAAAASESFDARDYSSGSGREGAKAAEQERQLQLVAAPDQGVDADDTGSAAASDGEGTGTWTGGAAGEEESMPAADKVAVRAAEGSGVDGERTGTWVPEAAEAAADAAADAGGRALEGPEGSSSEEAGQGGPSSSRPANKNTNKNWFQRLFGGLGGGGDGGKSLLLGVGLAVALIAAWQARGVVASTGPASSIVVVQVQEPEAVSHKAADSAVRKAGRVRRK